MKTNRKKKAMRTRVFAFRSEGISVGLPSRYAPRGGRDGENYRFGLIKRERENLWEQHATARIIRLSRKAWEVSSAKLDPTSAATNRPLAAPAIARPRRSRTWANLRTRNRIVVTPQMTNYIC